MNERQWKIKILVWIGLRFKRRFIRELARVEYGIAWYVRMLADEYPVFKNSFYAYATEEKYHGRMLAALIDELPESKGGLGLKRWACQPGAGKTRIEGVGKRYFVMRKILGNKSLNEYSFNDRLAIMAVLENISLAVYQEIVKQSSGKLKAIAAKIAEDEQGHQTYLTSIMTLIGVELSQCIEWEKKIIKALPIALLDLPKLFMRR
ncbi:ferritin-like domain-containing protein [Floridanema evergladense]|uniref:Ferritin-like domain-containing protein n=1 Tax=Floridaenema evergladense BLCC-F167 TaxID=3153639 RepID=A0ABV4WD33_9CYAN